MDVQERIDALVDRRDALRTQIETDEGALTPIVAALKGNNLSEIDRHVMTLQARHLQMRIREALSLTNALTFEAYRTSLEDMLAMARAPGYGSQADLKADRDIGVEWAEEIERHRAWAREVSARVKIDATIEIIPERPSQFFSRERRQEQEHEHDFGQSMGY